MNIQKSPWEVVEHNWSDTSIVETETDRTVCTLSIHSSPEEVTEENQYRLELAMAEDAKLISQAPYMFKLLTDMAYALMFNPHLLADEEEALGNIKMFLKEFE